MTKLRVLMTACLVGIAVSVTAVLDKPYYELENAENLFRDFVKQYRKSYSRREYSERLEIFKETLRDINRRNAKYPETVFGLNHFADLKPEELQQYRGFKPLNETVETVTIIDKSLAAPAQVDWRQNGVVSHVKNQQSCGSCYIFSAIGNIEGQYAMKNKECLALSEGQALDCLDRETCGGGWPNWVMDDFANAAGVMKEDDYPYQPAKGTCHQDKSKVVAHLQGSHNLDTTNEDTLAQNVAQIGPLSITLAAADFQTYQGGILQPEQCTGGAIDHAVLLVGYGEENGTKFWIIKNSWGAEWGEQGYVRLLRGVNACRIGEQGTATAIMA